MNEVENKILSELRTNFFQWRITRENADIKTRFNAIKLKRKGKQIITFNQLKRKAEKIAKKHNCILTKFKIDEENNDFIIKTLKANND